MRSGGRFPKLRGKASEVRHFSPALQALWEHHHNPNLAVHRQVNLMLKANCRLEELISDRLCFTSAVSHQDQWWSSCACALHLLATRDGSLGCSTYHLLLTPLSLVSHAHTLFFPPFFPPRHLVTSIYSMAHGAVIETFPVASRYRYIPNTLGGKRLR